MSLQTHEEPGHFSIASAIDVNSIEKQLAAMWRQQACEGEEEAAVTRACTQNLIVYTTPREDRVQID
jgi:hypothetical protein